MNEQEFLEEYYQKMFRYQRKNIQLENISTSELIKERDGLLFQSILCDERFDFPEFDDAFKIFNKTKWN